MLSERLKQYHMVMAAKAFAERNFQEALDNLDIVDLDELKNHIDKSSGICNAYINGIFIENMSKLELGEQNEYQAISALESLFDLKPSKQPWWTLCFNLSKLYQKIGDKDKENEYLEKSNDYS
jgi:hypothetical protein